MGATRTESITPAVRIHRPDPRPKLTHQGHQQKNADEAVDDGGNAGHQLNQLMKEAGRAFRGCNLDEGRAPQAQHRGQEYRRRGDAQGPPHHGVDAIAVVVRRPWTHQYLRKMTVHQERQTQRRHEDEDHQRQGGAENGCQGKQPVGQTCGSPIWSV